MRGSPSPRDINMGVLFPCAIVHHLQSHHAYWNVRWCIPRLLRRVCCCLGRAKVGLLLTSMLTTSIDHCSLERRCVMVMQTYAAAVMGTPLTWALTTRLLSVAISWRVRLHGRLREQDLTPLQLLEPKKSVLLINSILAFVCSKLSRTCKDTPINF